MKGLFGSLLLVAGFLIAGVSGLCAVSSFSDAQSDERQGVLLFFGIPFLIGVGILALGIAIIRSETLKGPRS